jgi:hypothetical protein
MLLVEAQVNVVSRLCKAGVYTGQGQRSAASRKTAASGCSSPRLT